MLKFFCDLTNAQFAAGFRDRSEPSLSFTQDNALPFRLYLLRSLSSPGWPYSYDSSSGDPAITAIVSLRDESTAAVLSSTSPLNPIKNGFEGLLHTNTLEVDDFLSARLEREALFSVDLVDGSGNKINPFRRSVLLRSSVAAGVAPAVLGTYLWMPLVDSLTGSSTSLDQVPTADLPARTLIKISIEGEGTSEWLKEETDEVAPVTGNGIVVPVDFNPVTMPFVLVKQ